jgi:predicted amidophosphoribosyltransferase
MGVLDLLLPERCASCGVDGAMLCAACTSALTALRPPFCERCGAATAWPVARCSECRARRLAFACARAAIAYEGPAVAFVRAWKDGGRRGAARLAAAYVAKALDRPQADAIAFVPAVRDRELWRGHNPARGLAAQLAEAWELPLTEAVRRTGGTRPQRGLGLDERRRNVTGAFRVVGRSPARVVLVDDVYTSGATVAAAAAALRAAGARRVEVVTFARTLRDRSAAAVNPGTSARLHPI